MTPRTVRAAALLAAVLLLGGCAAADPGATAGGSTPEGATGATAAAGTVEARALLDALPIEAETVGSAYDRERFGYGGDLDPDGDGCWTRREVLIRDSVVPARIGSSCFVTGQWRSAFDGVVTDDPDAFTIDHTVPLLEAWRSGADAWPDDRLVAFGNDLGYAGSLRAVTARLNEDKGNSDPSDWLPPEDRCGYVATWVAVKTRWGLAADPDEVAAIREVLAGCGAVRVARPGAPDLGALT